MTRQINQAGIDLIHKWEGCRLSVYQDSVGVFTIGYGHTNGVTCDTSDITQDMADSLFLQDISEWEYFVSNNVTVELNDNQFSALVSLSYNVGNFPIEHGKLGVLLNNGDYDLAASHFLLYDKAGGLHLQGLYNRRAEERALFLSENV